MSGEKNSNAMYLKMGARGLAKLAQEYKVNDDIEFVKKRAKKDEAILDLACGYGRVSLPLALDGYKYITGIDCAPNLIRAARQDARKYKIVIKYDLGSMTKLPYKDESFDKIFCLWNSFNQITTKKDRIKTLKEVHRVLKTNGKAFFIVCDPESKELKKKMFHESLKNGVLILDSVFVGVKSRQYIYSKKLLKNMVTDISFKKNSITRIRHNARTRLLLFLQK